MRPALVALLLAGALLLGGAAPQFNAPAAGLASWYGSRHEGHRTASGALFRAAGFTAASRGVPLGRVVRVCNLRNGLCAVVQVTDRGPYGYPGRIIDLSRAAMAAIGGLDAGVVPVVIERVP